MFIRFWRSFIRSIRRSRLKAAQAVAGRVDLGILRYTDEVWPSDNTDPLDRLSQQDGFTHAYPNQVMLSWVTDSPHWMNNRATSMTYRMLVSMEGALGIGANLNKLSNDDLATIKRLTAAYHGVQKTVAQGELYRLISPIDGMGKQSEFYRD